MTYDECIAAKVRKPQTHGFEPDDINPMLFDWQQVVTRWAIRQGRCALFEECGLGKTPQQLEWSRQVVKHSGGSVLILCPLAVAEQTVSEGVKFGVKVTHVRQPEEVTEPGIYITNYERLELFDGIEFAGVVLDESSILKSFMGKTRIKLTQRFANTPYRLCCTATPAPNDYMEFGQHAEFLGVMDSNEMLARWFINDTMNFGTYRLKGHATKDFWKWVSTWAACISKPSDIGFEDGAFILPPLRMELLNVYVDQTQNAPEGEMFRNATLNATNLHKEKRMTCVDRVSRIAAMVNESTEPWIVWCDTNYEADELVLQIKDAVEVRGSDKPEHKEAKLRRFMQRESRILLTKPSIAGYGLNLQFCRNVAFVGLSYSFEDFYQALRRSYRFGQTCEVNCYIVQADTEGNVMRTINRKIAQHETMREQMKFAAAALRNENDKTLSMNTEIESEQTESWKLHLGDCVRVAKTIESDSVDFSIYSPPFVNLYIYSADVQDMGNCENNEAFMGQYRFLIAEKLRITKPGCLTAVHCKNLVEYKGRDGRSGLHDFRGDIIREHEKLGWQYHSEHVIWKDPVIEMQRTKAQGLLFKQLCQNSRYSRSGMPEYVILFRKWAPGMENAIVGHAKGDERHWDYIGTDEPRCFNDERQREIQVWQRYASPVWFDIRQTNVLNGEIARSNGDEKHICPLQLDVIDRCLWLYTNPGDLVYSPFAGIGSEGYCAVKMGRRFVGSELKRSYFDLGVSYLRKAEDESRTLFDLATA